MGAPPLHRNRLIGTIRLHVGQRLLHRGIQVWIVLPDADADVILCAADIELLDRCAIVLDGDKHRHVIGDKGLNPAGFEFEKQLRQALIGTNRPARLFARPLFMGFTENCADGPPLEVIKRLNRRTFRHEDGPAGAIIRADEIDDLLPFGRDGHAADDGVELITEQAGDDTIPCSAYRDTLDAETLGDFVADIDIEASELIVVVDHTEGRVGAA